MKIDSLSNVDINELSTLYNLSYKNYYVPIHLNVDEFKKKLKMEDIDLNYSFGTFINNTLVGFLLYGIRIQNKKKISYIGGTGVSPDYRGNRILKQMLNYSFSKLKAIDVKSIYLDVNTKNDSAIKIYETCDFIKIRTLNSYKGIPILVVNPLYEIKTFSDLNLVTENFWNTKPTWKNDIQSIKNSIDNCLITGIFKDNNLVAYKIINKKNTRIYQFAVHHQYRNRYLASSLFSDLKNKEIKMININENELVTNNFIKSLGLSIYDNQYEMVKTL